ERARLYAAVGEIEAVEHRPNLDRERQIIERADPDGISRFPSRVQHMRTGLTAFLEHAHTDRLVLAQNLQPVLALAELDHAARIPANRAARELAGNLSLSLADREIDRGGDRGHQIGDLACGLASAESAGKFLGDERGRQPAGAEALVLHHRGEERNVVPDALDRELVERIRL